MALHDSLKEACRKLLTAKRTKPNWVKVLYSMPSSSIKSKVSARNKSLSKRNRQ